MNYNVTKETQKFQLLVCLNDFQIVGWSRLDWQAIFRSFIAV